MYRDYYLNFVLIVAKSTVPEAPLGPRPAVLDTMIELRRRTTKRVAVCRFAQSCCCKKSRRSDYLSCQYEHDHTYSKCS